MRRPKFAADTSREASRMFTTIAAVIVFSIHRLVGPQFERGLATMKHVAEH